MTHQYGRKRSNIWWIAIIGEAPELTSGTKALKEGSMGAAIFSPH